MKKSITIAAIFIILFSRCTKDIYGPNACFNENVLPIFISNCTMSGCHNSKDRKAGYDLTYKDKIDTYVKAAEFYAKAANIVGAEDMFARASREANSEQQLKIAQARKKVFLLIAEDLEKRGRMSNATKFYEHLLTLKLDDLEKSLIKKKLSDYYKKMGRFSEARVVETR